MVLQALDLEASYGPDSPGRTAGRLIDKSGKQHLGGVLWQIGEQAIVMLENAACGRGREYQNLRQLSDDLPRLVAGANEILDNRLPEAVTTVREHLFPSLADDMKSSMEQASLPVRVEFFAAITFEVHAHLVGPRYVGFIREFAALAILVSLDAAVIIQDQSAEAGGVVPEDVAALVGRLSVRLGGHNQLVPAIDALKSGWRSDRAREAAKHPRPQQNTPKTLATDAMRIARKAGMTLDGFIESAVEGSVPNVRIAAHDHRGVKRFVVDCDGADAGKTVARSTLERWWAQARPSINGATQHGRH